MGCAQSPRVWMEDLLEGGPRGAGVGNMRHRLAQSLIDKGMCEEKKESGLLTTTTRYPPTWRWRDEATDAEPLQLAGAGGGVVAEKVLRQIGAAATWTSREALVEQLQAWLLLPARADATSEGAVSPVLMGRRAALCGLAELCGVLGPAVLEVHDPPAFFVGSFPFLFSLVFCRAWRREAATSATRRGSGWRR